MNTTKNPLDYVVEAVGLSKAYAGRAVVKEVDLKVPYGGCFGLVGPNGAGKTTTLKMILGQSPPSAGRLRVFGLDMPQATRTVRASIGVVPQTDNLDPDFTVEENLQIYGNYFGLTKSELAPRIHTLLDLVELRERASTRINKLSGGMMRRLSIARALINDPELVVLDEPTTGLDPQVRHRIWTRLRELKLSGKTLLLTTHYMEEAERLCDTLVVMDQGIIIAEGSPPQLISDYVPDDVFEVHGDTQRVNALLSAIEDLRMDAVGDTTYCYTSDAARVVRTLEAAADVSYVRRPANLEDVFLTLTGRDLRE